MIRHWTIHGCDIYIFVGRNKNRDQSLPVSQIIHSGDHLPNTKEQEIILKICLFAASHCFGLASEPIILQEILACDWLALSDYSAIFTSQRVKMRELGVFSFFLEKDTCILRKLVVASLSRLLPRVYPQPPRSTSNIFPPPPPPPPSLKHRHASNHHSLFYTFVCGPFKFLLCITASDRGEYRKSSEINNRVNTLTPKIYKFSRLIYEHFLEEIV